MPDEEVKQDTKEQIRHLFDDRSEPALRKLAMDIVDGRVFTTLDLPENDKSLIHMVFLPLALLDEAGFASLKQADPGLLYEYISEAGPRSVNGYPIFWSYRMLSRPDTAKVRDYVCTLIAQRRAFLQTPPAPVEHTMEQAPQAGCDCRMCEAARAAKQ